VAGCPSEPGAEAGIGVGGAGPAGGIASVGAELAEAQRWAGEQGGLTEVEQRFLSASVEAQMAVRKSGGRRDASGGWLLPRPLSVLWL